MCGSCFVLVPVYVPFFSVLRDAKSCKMPVLTLSSRRSRRDALPAKPHFIEPRCSSPSLPRARQLFVIDIWTSSSRVLLGVLAPAIGLVLAIIKLPAPHQGQHPWPPRTRTCISSESSRRTSKTAQGTAGRPRPGRRGWSLPSGFQGRRTCLSQRAVSKVAHDSIFYLPLVSLRGGR